MNKILKFEKNKLIKKGSGNPLIVDKKLLGMGSSSVLLEERKENLMVGNGVVLNRPTNAKRKPLKLNL